MKIRYTSEFKKRLKTLLRENRKLANEVTDTINLLIVNPNYPGLRLHKLRNEMRELWSVSVKENLRIVFMYSGDGIVFTDIETHDEVYRMN